MALQGSLPRMTAPIHVSCHQSQTLNYAKLASGRRLHARQQNVSLRRQRCPPCCDSRPGAPSPIGDGAPSEPPPAAPAPGSRGWSPFANNKKQDSARGALQDLFKDRKDQLADFDDAPGGGSGGKGKGKGGGGGGGSGGEDAGENKIDWLKAWRQFREVLRQIRMFIAAFLIWFSVVTFLNKNRAWPSMLNDVKYGAIWLFRYLLRLASKPDQPPEERRGRQFALDENLDLGKAETLVIQTYDVEDLVGEYASDSDDKHASDSDDEYASDSDDD